MEDVRRSLDDLPEEDSPPFPFLSLPAEIRRTVYQFLFSDIIVYVSDDSLRTATADGDRDDQPNSDRTALLHTCRVVGQEAIISLCRWALFEIPDFGSLHSFVELVRLEYMCLMKYLKTSAAFMIAIYHSDQFQERFSAITNILISGLSDAIYISQEANHSECDKECRKVINYYRSHSRALHQLSFKPAIEIHLRFLLRDHLGSVMSYDEMVCLLP